MFLISFFPSVIFLFRRHGVFDYPSWSWLKPWFGHWIVRHEAMDMLEDFLFVWSQIMWGWWWRSDRNIADITNWLRRYMVFFMEFLSFDNIHWWWEKLSAPISWVWVLVLTNISPRFLCFIDGWTDHIAASAPKYDKSTVLSILFASAPSGLSSFTIESGSGGGGGASEMGILVPVSSPRISKKYCSSSSASACWLRSARPDTREGERGKRNSYSSRSYRKHDFGVTRTFSYATVMGFPRY